MLGRHHVVGRHTRNTDTAVVWLSGVQYHLIHHCVKSSSFSTAHYYVCCCQAITARNQQITSLHIDCGTPHFICVCVCLLPLNTLSVDVLHNPKQIILFLKIDPLTDAFSVLFCCYKSLPPVKFDYKYFIH